MAREIITTLLISVLIADDPNSIYLTRSKTGMQKESLIKMAIHLL